MFSGLSNHLTHKVNLSVSCLTLLLTPLQKPLETLNSGRFVHLHKQYFKQYFHNTLGYNILGNLTLTCPLLNNATRLENMIFIVLVLKIFVVVVISRLSHIISQNKAGWMLPLNFISSPLWLQVDPDVFAALPRELQEELRSAYSRRENVQPQGTVCKSYNQRVKYIMMESLIALCS